MRTVKAVGLAVFMVLWASLLAYPSLHPRLNERDRSAEKSFAEPELFFPMLGAWTLPESPILRLSSHQDRPGCP
jgi:hypothetical protein